MNRLAALLVPILAVLALSGCAPAASAPVAPADAQASASISDYIQATAPRADLAADVLATLPVKGRAPMTGYSRAQFGAAWKDTDHNGCDQRDDVLRRDLSNPVLRPGSRCVVASGTLRDPYTTRTIAWSRGVRSAAVQIDHVVALGDAWQTGAQQLSAAEREALATDTTLNLLAVDGPTNQAKGDSDAATWLPPAKAFRCSYVARQIAVKQHYRLWVTQAEHDAMARVLAGCPDRQVPTTGGPW